MQFNNGFEPLSPALPLIESGEAAHPCRGQSFILMHQDIEVALREKQKGIQICLQILLIEITCCQQMFLSLRLSMPLVGPIH